MLLRGTIRCHTRSAQYRAPKHVYISNPAPRWRQQTNWQLSRSISSFSRPQWTFSSHKLLPNTAQRFMQARWLCSSNTEFANSDDVILESIHDVNDGEDVKAENSPRSSKRKKMVINREPWEVKLGKTFRAFGVSASLNILRQIPKKELQDQHVAIVLRHAIYTRRFELIDSILGVLLKSRIPYSSVFLAEAFGGISHLHDVDLNIQLMQHIMSKLRLTMDGPILNSLVSVCAIGGNESKMLDYLEMMKEQNYSVRGKTFGAILQFYAEAHNQAMVMHLIQAARRSSTKEKEASTEASSSEKPLDRRMSLLEYAAQKIDINSSATITAILKSLTTLNMTHAIDELVKMVKANKLKISVKFFRELLRLYTKQTNVSKVYSTLDDMRAHGFDLDAIILNDILKMHIRLGQATPEDLSNIFTRYDVGITAELYHALVELYSEREDVDGCLRTLKEMQERDFPLNIITFTTIMKALVKANRFDEVDSVVQMILADKSLRMDVAAYTMTIIAYYEKGDFEKVLKFFMKMKVDDIKPLPGTWIRIFNAAKELKRLEQAVGICQDLIATCPDMLAKQQIRQLVSEAIGICQDGNIRTQLQNVLEEAERKWGSERQTEGLEAQH